MPRLLWSVSKAIAFALLGAVVAGLTLYVLQARSMPDLEPWHTAWFDAEFDADRDIDEDFAAYLAREQTLLADLEEWTRSVGPTGAGSSVNRFSPDYVPFAPVDGDWNRSLELEVAKPAPRRGSVLLVHGLSDSPYSVRALAHALREHGLHAVVLRLPGHGTIPGALRHVSWRDWQAAFEIAARHAGRLADGKRFWIAGYSTGGGLAIDYALRILDDEIEGAPLPDRILLLSPAIGVASVAALASFQNDLSALPGLEKLAWTSIQPEYDPYKYGSFPVRGGEEVYNLTSAVETRFARLHEAGGLGRLPPILAFQSLVDATVSAAAVKTFFGRLPDNGSELVVFDLNRRAEVDRFFRARYRITPAIFTDEASLPYALTIVGNAGPDTDDVVARRRPAGGGEWSEARLGLRWPPSVYSLAHVALPFPAGDPFYGSRAVLGRSSLGSLDVRGERGVLSIPAGDFIRLRHNPFFDYVTSRSRQLLEQP